MSLPFKLIQFGHAVAAKEGRTPPGRPPSTFAFTLRISGKEAIRNALNRGFGYTHA